MDFEDVSSALERFQPSQKCTFNLSQQRLQMNRSHKYALPKRDMLFYCHLQQRYVIAENQPSRNTVKASCSIQ